MTKQSEIAGDPRYVALLDHGFVGLVDHMGSDGAIVEAARTSYGKGTRTVRGSRGLIRYLMRHHHNTPVEMCEIKLHIRLPIFVMRQLVRHRTASLNEQSARYSEMSDEFYVPEASVLAPQSADNKQGRAGTLAADSAAGSQWLMRAAHDTSYGVYMALLGEKDPAAYPDGRVAYDATTAFPDGSRTLPEDFPGIAREIARGVLPVSAYTECFWKQNLHNLLHMIKLRSDAHAQYEIRVYADAIYRLIEPLFPMACEAFEDYVRGSLSLSRMERALLKTLLTDNRCAGSALWALVEQEDGVAPLATSLAMSERELREFAEEFGLTGALTTPP